MLLQISMRVLAFIKPLKQYWTASIRLIAALQYGAVPPAAEALLRSIALQTNSPAPAVRAPASAPGDVGLAGDHQPSGCAPAVECLHLAFSPFRLLRRMLACCGLPMHVCAEAAH